MPDLYHVRERLLQTPDPCRHGIDLVQIILKRGLLCRPPRRPQLFKKNETTNLKMGIHLVRALQDTSIEP